MDGWLLEAEEAELAELEPRDFRGAAAAIAVNTDHNMGLAPEPEQDVETERCVCVCDVTKLQDTGASVGHNKLTPSRTG